MVVHILSVFWLHSGTTSSGPGLDYAGQISSIHYPVAGKMVMPPIQQK